jgi:hypothetical protein
MGLNKEECVVPSVKTLGYCQYASEYYEMAWKNTTKVALDAFRGVRFANLFVTAVIAENERSGEHQTALSIVRAHLVLLGDEAVFVQKPSSTRSGLVDLLGGIVHRSNFMLDLAHGALGYDGNHDGQ